MTDGPAAVTGLVNVSRETVARLETYVRLLHQWQPAQNLVAAGTLDDVWRRHVADSAQLAVIQPDARRWLDLGSGAGFPGMVLAILAADRDGAHVHLVESNRRKCAFLRAVARETEVPVTVHAGRVASLLAGWSEPVDVVCARAVAPLVKLLTMAAPVLASGVPALFHKGQDFVHEVEEATKYWDFDLLKHPSRIDADGVILQISHVHRH